MTARFGREASTFLSTSPRRAPGPESWAGMTAPRPNPERTSSLWLLPAAVPLGWAAWVSFLLASGLTGDRRLLGPALAYLLVAAAAVGVLSGGDGEGLSSGLAIAASAALWVVGLVHGLRLRRAVAAIRRQK